MNASKPTHDESLEFSTAQEFFTRSASEERDRDPDAPPFAKSIVWIDQLSPLFVCESCHQHVQHLEWTGNGRADDYEEKRAAAYDELFSDDPACDVCAGALPEKVDR